MVDFGCGMFEDLECGVPALDLRRGLGGLSKKCEGEGGSAEDIHGVLPFGFGYKTVMATGVGFYGVNAVHYL